MRFRFSIRSVLLAVLLLAPICFYTADYLKKRSDFILPSSAELIAWQKDWETQNDAGGTVNVATKQKPSVHARYLTENFPPLGIEHWERKGKKVEPKMHKLALVRYVPPVNTGISLLCPERNSQVFVYAVDSELAAICEITVQGEGPYSIQRVVKFHGFQKHNLSCDEWGSLKVTDLTFDDDDQAKLVFAADGA